MQKVEFGDEYFSNRNLNDLRRMRSFALEAKFMSQYAQNTGTVCDVGCSTGEFLKFINWQGKKFGIEINSFAADEAKKASIHIIEDLQDTLDIFDVVILRGTIQHLPSPFETIKMAFDKLRPGGVLFLIATPNTDSIYFRIFGDLPAFDFPRNYWLPGFKQLKIVCEREGFIFSGVQYPYLNSGYASRWDFIKFLTRIIVRSSRLGCAFPRNMMNLAFSKPITKENS